LKEISLSLYFIEKQFVIKIIIVYLMYFLSNEEENTYSTSPKHSKNTKNRMFNL